MSDGLEQLGAALADRYRLERELGQGGMATVYLAHDLRHDRKVALKVLRPELAAIIGAGRFLAEIKTTANLQHPHILPLFDSGQVDGTVFYVMPFVAGESLRDRLVRERQLAIDDAVRITREVADALSAAHAAGVIHRDIKPENILLQGGHALVADFGIALAATRADGTGRMTETGMSLGTPHYMSPEQAIGERTLDARTDVYALGCVLYEMLVGEPPFTGASAQAILAKVMTERPAAPSVTRDTVPPGVEAAVLTALAKLPVDRFPTAAAFSDALTRPGVRPLAHEQRRPLARTVALAATAIAAGLIGDQLLHRSASTDAVGDLEPRRYSIILPDSAPLLANGPLPFLATRSLSVSPDGQLLVYLAGTPTGRHLRLVRLDGGPSSDLPHTDDAMLPTFSPDGQYIAFIAEGAVQRLSLEDQTVSRLGTPLGLPSGLHWDADGRIYLTSSTAIGCLRAVEATGGAEAGIGSAQCDADALGERVPETEWLLSHAHRSLTVISSNTGLPRSILLATGGNEQVGGTNPLLLPDGNLVFIRDSTVYGGSLDPNSLALRAEPREIFPGVRREVGVGQVQWSLTASGTLVWVPGGDLGMARLAFVDRAGSVVDTVFGAPSRVGSVALSPDGRRIAVERQTDGGSRVVILDLDRRVEDQVAAPGPLVVVNWLRSGRGFVVGLGSSIFPIVQSGLVDINGRLTSDSADTTLLDESPDGVRQCGNRGGFSLWRRDAPEAPIRLDKPATFCRFSPDGKSVAWTDFNGAIYRAPVDASGPEARIRISDFGIEFKWSPDSREILYLHGEWGDAMWGSEVSMYSVRVPSHAGERAGQPRLLFKGRWLDAQGPAFDVGPDGRALVILGNKVAPVTRLEVMTNFPKFVARKLKAANP